MEICPSKLHELLTTRAEAQVQNGELGCAQLIVHQHGKEIANLVFGTDPLGEKPLVRNKIYRIASMTKPITVVAVLQQVDLGRIDLMAPVSDYIPGYGHMKLGHCEDGKLVVDGDSKEVLRVFNLLSHTNGMDVSPMCEAAQVNHPRSTLAATVEYYEKLPLAFEPFTAIGYSVSAGYDVAARIVELVSGESFENYLRKHILEPLGMFDTGYTPSEAQWSRFIDMHDRNAEGKSFVCPTTPGCVFENFPPTATLAGGGMFSTAEDYSLFAEMLLNKGTGRNGVRILSEESLRKMSTGWVPETIQPGPESWGLGVRTVARDGALYGEQDYLPVGTFGWSGAYGCHFWVDPVNEITAILMRNSWFDSRGCGTIGRKFEIDVLHSLIAD